MGEEKVQTKSTSISLVTVIIAILALIALIAIIANVNRDYKKERAGKYEIVGMTKGEREFTPEQLSKIKDYSYIIELELKEDGTGLLTVSDKKEEFIYDKKEMTFKVKVKKEEKEEKIPYTFEKNKISFAKEDSKFVFEKIQNK